MAKPSPEYRKEKEIKRRKEVKRQRGREICRRRQTGSQQREHGLGSGRV